MTGEEAVKLALLVRLKRKEVAAAEPGAEIELPDMKGIKLGRDRVTLRCVLVKES